MRLSQSPPTLLSLLAVVLSSTHTAQAKPYPRALSPLQNDKLIRQACAVPCGYYGQLCCQADQVCYTDSSNEAQCGVATAGANDGSWQMFTTTYVETDLVTVITTYSSYVTAAPVGITTVTEVTGVQTAICNANLNQVSCGPICCAQGQFCEYSGQCMAYTTTAPEVLSTIFVTAVASTASAATAAIRPTSVTVETITETAGATVAGTVTTTVPFETAVSTSGVTVSTSTKHGLSSGAIAGIVIGVLAALFILFIVCICCCAKGIIDGCLDLLGLRNRRKTTTEETVVASHRSRRGNSASGARPHFTTGTATRTEEKKDSGWGMGSWLGVGAALGALALCLGLRRERKAAEEKRTEYSGGSYSYSDYTSASSESSDRRTRDSRRSRR